MKICTICFPSYFYISNPTHFKPSYHSSIRMNIQTCFPTRTHCNADLYCSSLFQNKRMQFRGCFKRQDKSEHQWCASCFLSCLPSSKSWSQSFNTMAINMNKTSAKILPSATTAASQPTRCYDENNKNNPKYTLQSSVRFYSAGLIRVFGTCLKISFT